MAGAKLDRSRDYGVVVGDTEGRLFCQDGLYFDAAGMEIGGQASLSTVLDAAVFEGVDQSAVTVLEATPAGEDAEVGAEVSAEIGPRRKRKAAQ